MRDHEKIYYDSCMEVQKELFLMDVSVKPYDQILQECRRFEILTDHLHFQSKIEYRKCDEEFFLLNESDDFKFDDLYIKYNTYVITTFFYRFHDRGLP